MISKRNILYKLWYGIKIMGRELYKDQLRQEWLSRVCREYGFDSHECQSSTEIYAMQRVALERQLGLNNFTNTLWLIFFGIVAIALLAKLYLLFYETGKKENPYHP